MTKAKPYPKSVQVPQRKKYRRVVASAKRWAALQDERQGPCVLCVYLGTSQELPSTLHHVAKKGGTEFGDDVAENLVPLCGTGTTGHHGQVTAGWPHTLQALAAAIQRDEPAVYAYAIDKLGEDGFLRAHKVAFGCVVDESGGVRESAGLAS